MYRRQSIRASLFLTLVLTWTFANADKANDPLSGISESIRKEVDKDAFKAQMDLMEKCLTRQQRRDSKIKNMYIALAILKAHKACQVTGIEVTETERSRSIEVKSPPKECQIKVDPEFGGISGGEFEFNFEKGTPVGLFSSAGHFKEDKAAEGTGLKSPKGWLEGTEVGGHHQEGLYTGLVKAGRCKIKDALEKQPKGSPAHQ